MRIIRSSFVLVALATAPLVVTAETTKTEAKKPELTLDAIVGKHITALGGEQLLRGGTSFTFTVTGDKQGKKFTKTVWQARPNKMRVDITSDEGNFSKGFDGKVAWMKKGTDKPTAMSADETAMMALHATFEEPLLDYAKKGTGVKLVGKVDLRGTEAYDLEVKLKSGDVEHHFLDATSFLLIQKTWTSKDKDGKVVPMQVGFGDYKKVQGRMVNHSVTWTYEGKASTSVISNVSFDKAVDAKLFVMPK
jgi:outer membrane lipoprotein-sorting protein